MCWAGRKGAGGGPLSGAGGRAPPEPPRPGPRGPRGRGAGRLRLGGGRQVRRSRSPRLGGALRRGCRGLRGWEGASPGPARLPGGGEEAREAGRRRRSPRNPLAQRRPLHSEPRPPPAPQPTWGRNFLGSRAPEESAQPCDDRRRRPEPGTPGPGPPSGSAAGSAPRPPRTLSPGDPGRRARSRPGGSRVRGLRDPGSPGSGWGGPRAPRRRPPHLAGVEQTPRRVPRSGALPVRAASPAPGGG